MHYISAFVAMLGLGAAAPLLMAPPEIGIPIPASYFSSPQHTSRSLDHPLRDLEKSKVSAEPITGSDDDTPVIPRRSDSVSDSGDVTEGPGPLPKRSESTIEVNHAAGRAGLVLKRCGPVAESSSGVDEPGCLPKRSESTTEVGDGPGRLP